ncbi:MAG: flagellar basal body L-ring protein FlgH [Deltaproteobacteria bacterium]|nr:flagellar basal body L-ring protein FlgH [Deltaproteobacteria bacterium]
MNKTSLGLLCLLCLGGMACASTHVAPYEPKRREYNPDPVGERSQPGGASLMSMGQQGFLENNRANQIGDSLVIRIDENENATRQATTQLSKKGSQNYGVPHAFGLVEALRSQDLDPSQLFGTNSESDFDGNGKTSRSGKLSATLPVRVRKVLGNGDLFVEGHKVVMVSNEEHHLYVSGVVRPIDVQYDNSVSSSRVADAEIEYTGRGDSTDVQRPGIVSRFLSKFWPF